MYFSEPKVILIKSCDELFIYNSKKIWFGSGQLCNLEISQLSSHQMVQSLFDRLGIKQWVDGLAFESFKGLINTVVMGSSWIFPARASPSYENSELSRAELGHFNFRAETKLKIFKS